MPFHKTSVRVPFSFRCSNPKRMLRTCAQLLPVLFIFLLTCKLFDPISLVEILIPWSRRKLPPEVLRNLSIYNNRYCLHRNQSQGAKYGYASVIRQMRWIKNNEEKVSRKDGPLIFYGNRYLWHGLSSDGCQYYCRFSTDFADYSAAVLAVFTKDPPSEALPKPDKQIWAFETGESPLHMSWISPLAWRNFTIFLTTKSDSHVPWVYAVFAANKNPEKIVPLEEQLRMLGENHVRWLPEHHSQRTGKVVALVSNWSPKNRRAEYIYELSDYISVDIYGQSHFPCLPVKDDCLRYLSLHYKFYLAFENSNCKDYITEKLFENALMYDMIPVVMGAPRDDYCALAPPNSFIHVDDFSSPAELAKYLNWLDLNDTAYASYFAWKDYGRIMNETRMDCRLCGFLHQHLKGLSSIPTKGFNYFTNSFSLCKYF